MATMLRSALDWLRGLQAEHLAEGIVYTRAGGTPLELSAVPGKTTFKTWTNYGSWIWTLSYDFIVPRRDLGFDPAPGDTISHDGCLYEVRAPGGEPVWRWSDPLRTAVRIHTKRLSP